MKLFHPVPVVPGALLGGPLIGALVGIVARPTFLNSHIPLGVLTSAIPADAPFREELANHLMLTTATGLVMGAILAIVAAMLLNREDVAVHPRVREAEQLPEPGPFLHQSGNRNLLYLCLVLLGAIAGGLVGILTRPSLLGIPIPLEILTSLAPLDAPLKAELADHLVLTTGIGLVTGIVLALVVAALFGRRAAGTAAPVGSPASFKGLVVFSAGAIAATLAAYLLLPEAAFTLFFLCVAILCATAGVLTIFLETSKASR